MLALLGSDRMGPAAVGLRRARGAVVLEIPVEPAAIRKESTSQQFGDKQDILGSLKFRPFRACRARELELTAHMILDVRSDKSLRRSCLASALVI